MPNGQSYGERLAKETFWSPATRGSNIDSDRAITLTAEAVCVPAHLAPPESSQSKQLCHLHIQPSLGQSCHRQKKSGIYACGLTLVVSNSWQPCGLWPARLLSVGFSSQEYWSLLPNTDCHTLLEYCISCCPSCQLPWVPGAARIPATQAAVPPPHLPSLGQAEVFQGSLRSKLQGTTHMQRWK